MWTYQVKTDRLCSNASESLEAKRWRRLRSAAVAEFLNSDFTEKTEIF